MKYEVLDREARARHLRVLGGFHANAQDGAPDGCKTLIMLGPDEPAFWSHMQSQPEIKNGGADPVDRWSKRVIGAWAGDLGATPLYPFGGPPYLPFFRWATRTWRIHASPIMLLVHDRAGLFVSFRGALAFPVHIELPAAPPNPCDTCADQPCRQACPVNALDGKRYDVPKCRSHVTSLDQTDCMQLGCAARRACPVSQAFNRNPEQSAYHMRQFTNQ